MKMIAYAVEPEEIPIFEKYCPNYNIDLKLLSDKPSLENIALANVVNPVLEGINS